MATLEKRVEFILDNDLGQGFNYNDKLRNSLNELLRENEGLKREITHKMSEIERLQGSTGKLNEYILRLTKKIDNLKRKPHQPNRDTGGNAVTYNQGAVMFKKDDIDLLSN